MTDHLATRRKYEDSTSRYLDVDGLRLHVRVEGSGPSLLLLHGIMASLHTWDGWVAELKRFYRVVRIDLPGFGLSSHIDAPDLYTSQHCLHLLDRVVTALGLDHFYLAGNSLGGFLSWFYAANRPNRVSKLILIAPVAYTQRLPQIMRLVSLPLIGEIAERFTPRFLVERNVHEVYGDAGLVSRGTVDRYYELLMYQQNRLAMVRTCRALRPLSSVGLHVGMVSTVKCPTLLMWGERDRWVPPELVEAWRRDVPQVEVRLYAKAGHVPMEELPTETARDAHSFLQRGAPKRL